MWKCFGCGRYLGMVEENLATGLTICLYCGSHDVTRIEEGSLLSKEAIANNWGHSSKDQVSSVTPTRNDDAFIVNSLLRCVAPDAEGKNNPVDYPTIFSLVWGDKMIDNENFPLELRTIVANIHYREKGKEECLDPIEKKLHDIIIDLLYILYEKQVNDLVEQIEEQVKLSMW